ncbi:hypothetical protein SCHPADRAFT_899391 [Schizopora paradoxa]|uniref:Mid2 domain-containing protein n=1 Tax=Schizopora paradoxa TaxID=27342 RepID=A0A0H2S3E0_9AGAM|nr:hypothetical protein SCHPADRAFT_899391 [Schizopora paradoxa]
MRLKEFLLVSFLVLGVAAKHGESEGAPPASSSGSGSPAPSSTTTSVISSQPSPPPATSPAPTSSTTQAPTNSNPSQSTSSAPAASTSHSSIPIQFNTVNDMLACSSVTFSWTSLSNTPVTLTVAVTNDRSTQNNIIVRQAQTILVTQVISTNTSSTAGSIKWPMVDIPNGTYAVLAFQTGNQNAGMVESNLFNVAEGNNTACLSAASSSVSLPVASATSSMTASDSSNSSEGSTGNVGGSSKSLSTGALIGVVIGVVMGVLGLIVAFTLMHRKDVLRVRRPRRPGAPYYLF